MICIVLAEGVSNFQAGFDHVLTPRLTGGLYKQPMLVQDSDLDELEDKNRWYRNDFRSVHPS